MKTKEKLKVSVSRYKQYQDRIKELKQKMGKKKETPASGE